MKNIGYLLVLFVVLLSCNQDDSVEVYSNDMVGKWEWKSTNGGEAGRIYKTPQNTDKIIHLDLKPDFEYTILLNNKESISGTYSIINKKSILTEETEQFISITTISEESKSIVVLEGIINVYNYSNSLFINQDFENGMGSVFERVD
ncbi:hypothetical protein SAMN05444411_10539 [Lutibacter oricola]|uniref:Lipocalin-like domain-containing protein n=1 Tax=Lutibacter oricola TaxID=762486 RepID=A0A1H3B745_9FLAO|nr:hypothetical protein [Lutibacter oricola]SDX37776.1 hypothetical protein SAMN05444411_10539 [Lutibacter oricola]